MDIGHTAKYLSVSRNTLKKWIREYHLPATTIDGTTRINKQALDSWMNNNQKSKQEA